MSNLSGIVFSSAKNSPPQLKELTERQSEPSAAVANAAQQRFEQVAQTVRAAPKAMDTAITSAPSEAGPASGVNPPSPDTVTIDVSTPGVKKAQQKEAHELPDFHLRMMVAYIGLVSLIILSSVFNRLLNNDNMTGSKSNADGLALVSNLCLYSAMNNLYKAVWRESSSQKEQYAKNLALVATGMAVDTATYYAMGSSTNLPFTDTTLTAGLAAAGYVVKQFSKGTLLNRATFALPSDSNFSSTPMHVRQMETAALFGAITMAAGIAFHYLPPRSMATILLSGFYSKAAITIMKSMIKAWDKTAERRNAVIGYSGLTLAIGTALGMIFQAYEGNPKDVIPFFYDLLGPCVPMVMLAIATNIGRRVAETEENLTLKEVTDILTPMLNDTELKALPPPEEMVKNLSNLLIENKFLCFTDYDVKCTDEERTELLKQLKSFKKNLEKGLEAELQLLNCEDIEALPQEVKDNPNAPVNVINKALAAVKDGIRQIDTTPRPVKGAKYKVRKNKDIVKYYAFNTAITVAAGGLHAANIEYANNDSINRLMVVRCHDGFGFATERDGLKLKKLFDQCIGMLAYAATGIAVETGLALAYPEYRGHLYVLAVSLSHLTGFAMKKGRNWLLPKGNPNK